ncbi:MAG: hypothetical protein NC299_00320 [Lachnospiraceae bacterium]|nr:hypothetical protein [Ruminococcus sp.]MCM1273790.1 hypothetical protein [Lachnospiraceae bacterium]
MFDKQYRFSGTHAEMVSNLTAVFDDSSKSKLFERNLDVYINAPLIGFLYKKRGVKSTDSEIANQNIFPEQLINFSDQLQCVFRLILLLDSDYEPDESKRLDKAFRYFGKNEEDLKRFDEYVLGGVEVLHEKLIENALKPSDYVDNLFDFLEDFNDKFNEDITSEDIMSLCIGKK